VPREKKEADMYKPFIDRSMAILECLCDVKVDGMQELVSKVDIKLKLNNQTVIAQNHDQTISSWKPDVIVIPSHRQSNCSKKHWNNTKQVGGQPNEAKEKKGKDKVCWQDVLSIFKFKWYGKMDSPPA